MCSLIMTHEETFVGGIDKFQPFEAWIYHCHLHPLQAARLVVDGDDLKRVK